MALKLIIGNKNYSSWSMRPWIAMKVAGIAFEETVISLDAADFKAKVGAVSGTGKVPVLIDNDVRVWESLAILEYLAEKFPAAGLWPADSAARAYARVIANEMHAGFLPLRKLLPMNMWRPIIKRELTPDAAANVRRIEAIWSDCRMRFGKGWWLTGAALLTYAIPAALLAIPFQRAMHSYGLTDTPWAVIAAQVTLATPFAILILRHYASLIPLELDDATCGSQHERLGHDA